MKYEFYAHDRRPFHRIFSDVASKIKEYELSKIKDVLSKEMIVYLRKAESTAIDDRRADAFAADDNYATLLEVYSTVAYWNTLKEVGGYEIHVTNVYAENDGWKLVFELDVSKLPKNQQYYAFGLLRDEHVFKVFK